MTERIPLEKIVRYACECAGLAAFCAGLDLLDLLRAAEAADRGDWDAARDAARDARDAAGDAAYAAYASDAARAAYASDAARAAYATDAAYDAAAYAAYASDAARAACAGCAADAARAAYAAARAADAAYDAAATTAAAARNQCAARARELLFPGHWLGSELRRAVAAHIEANPELHNQCKWGDGSADPACGTPCCVAGWACHLGGGSRGLPVELAAAALLYSDSAPLPSFDGGASRKSILEALRAGL